MKALVRNIKWTLNRWYVKQRQFWRALEDNSAYKDLDSSELSVVKKVEMLAIANKQAIRFDPTTNETLIVLDDLLVTLQNQHIKIDNHQGFSHITVPSKAYDKLLTIIRREAHRERRRLKYQVKQNLQKFINKIG